MRNWRRGSRSGRASGRRAKPSSLRIPALSWTGNWWWIAETGRPFAGDMDVFDVRGRYGETLPEAVVQEVMSDLRKHPEFSQVMHGEHMGWDYSGADNTIRGEDGRTAFERYQNIDQDIRSRHSRAHPSPEGLVVFSPQSGIGRPTAGEAFFNPPEEGQDSDE